MLYDLTSTVKVTDIPKETESLTTVPAVNAKEGRKTAKKKKGERLENSTHVSSEGETIGKLDTCVELI